VYSYITSLKDEMTMREHKAWVAMVVVVFGKMCVVDS